jgi:hypothetical protein
LIKVEATLAQRFPKDMIAAAPMIPLKTALLACLAAREGKDGRFALG